MSWQEAQQRHADSLSLTSYKAEELIARRVMRGLGYVIKRLPDIERALGVPVDADEPVWNRTEAALRGLAIRSGMGWVFGQNRDYPGMFRITTLESDTHRKAIQDLLPVMEAEALDKRTVYLTRIKGTDISKAYFLVDADGGTDWRWLKPPFSALQAVGQRWLVEQDTEAFVAQFGPYTFGPGADG